MSAIEIVDRGRGPQLSTSRITVQDVFPYMQRRCTYEQIREVMPVLSVEEIQVIERYVAEHVEELAAQDQRIRDRTANARVPPAVHEAHQRGGEEMERLRQAFHQKAMQEATGDHVVG